MDFTKSFYPLVEEHFLNHVQLEKPHLVEPNKNDKSFANMCQKHQNEHNFYFTNPNEVNPIALESP